METTIKKTNQSTMLTMLAVVSCALLLLVQSISIPHYLPTSKIEEGTIVVRNDNVTTVVIPDKR